MGLGIVCAGQGVQSLDMFTFLHEFPELTEHFKFLENYFGFNLYPHIHLKKEEIFKNHFAQPLIVAQTYLQWLIIKDKIPVPVAFTGYSLGELTAYACAGAFDLPQVLKIASKRAELMDRDSKNTKSAMLGVTGLNSTQLNGLCLVSSCYIAIQNSSNHFVIGGREIDLLAFEKLIYNNFPYAKITPIKVTIPSHTPLLSQAAIDFKLTIENEHWNEFTSPVVTGINAETIYDKKDACLTLSRQISTTIRFNQCIKVINELGADIILEIGPGNTLSKIANSLQLHLKTHSLNDFSSTQGVVEWVNNLSTF